MDNQLIGIVAKTLIAILVITILLSVIVFIWREQYQKEWFGVVPHDGFTDFLVSDNQKATPKYIMWIGDVITTLDILNLAQQPGVVIQPIYIPDPANSQARTEYELQITRSLRAMINTKYPQSQILPIIGITRERPDDAAFNQKYDDYEDGTSISSTRENTLRRWAKYYKLPLTQPSTATTNIATPTAKSNNQNLQPTQKQTKTQTQKQTQKQKNKKKSNTNILSETWNCRFPVGADGTPCGLCKKCEKLNSL
jgi:hypothetical protein